MELFVERGFARTTVPDIAQRAGLTTRTFFRHYADKREVLFAGEDELPEVVARVFTQSPNGLSPLEVIVRGLQTVVAPRLEGEHSYLGVRRGIVNSDAGLQEREAHKLASLGRAATTGFAGRGLTPLQAAIAASLAVATYDAAFNMWLDADGTASFADAVTTSAETLSLVASWPSIDTGSRRQRRATPKPATSEPASPLR
jgi:AcrR family transcriptional regulator